MAGDELPRGVGNRKGSLGPLTGCFPHAVRLQGKHPFEYLGAVLETGGQGPAPTSSAALTGGELSRRQGCPKGTGADNRPDVPQLSSRWTALWPAKLRTRAVRRDGGHMRASPRGWAQSNVFYSLLVICLYGPPDWTRFFHEVMVEGPPTPLQPPRDPWRLPYTMRSLE